MKKLLLAATMLASVLVQANDGGVAAIKVDQIRMRETALINGSDTIVKRIAKPSYSIVIEGGEAAKLQKILPSTVSVFTGMFPDQAQAYKDSFKQLGIYNEASKGITSKVLSISCSDATFNSAGNKVVKTGKSVCTITINAVEDGVSASDSFGDAQTFEPKTCK